MKPVLVAACVGALLCLRGSGAEVPASIRVYSHLLDPREHPDYDRRAVKPPTWDTFKNRTQFTTLRGFNVENDRIVGYAEELDKFTRQFELGDVIWPSYPILFAKNLGEFADEIARRDLYLFDIWGYVPGSGPGGYWQQFLPPKEAFATLESKLGERWLGTDIGEQDGRYIGGYANQMTPASASRFEQYLNFQRHFERMSDDLGHRHATLVSLNFGHYFLKEGTYTLIGAETAQALPNSQVYYAFIRGAGKQYGVPWFGNASIYNRWGYKTYGSAGGSGGDTHGPTKGTSLSLLKRLLYSHILYNSVAVGFENMWFEGDQLSPIGRIQQAAQRWVKANGQPGVMHTPVALLLDFYAGWTFPRHLYTDKLYRVWGNLPYTDGDYLTDAVLNLIYPGYADASYFHDESGFLTATPYGDIADCLLSDAPLWVLQRYPIVIVAGELAARSETTDKLKVYAANGGTLVITSANLRRLEPESVADQTQERRGSTKYSGSKLVEPEFKYGELRVERGEADRVLAWLEPPGEYGLSEPLAFERAFGKGRIIMLAAEYGITSSPQTQQLESRVDISLPSPYPLLEHVSRILNRVLKSQVIFEVSPRLHLITCRKGPGEYTLGVFNNTWHELPLQISSRCGQIESLRELALDQSEKGAVGYTPEGIDPASLGRSTDTTIAGGDVRIFAVKVRETNVVEIAQVRPPARAHGRFLPLRKLSSLQEEILARPTFFEHFDGMVVDWRYLHDREPAALTAESGWLARQGLRIAADLSSGIDLYPTLRLIDNLPTDYAASRVTIANVLAKMEILGARDLILSLHRHPENNFTDEQTDAAFEATLKALAQEAGAHQVTLHLRLAFGKPPWNLDEGLRWLDRVGAPNLKLAPSTALLAGQTPSPALAERLKGRLGFWLVAAPRRDIAGQLWDAHAPVSAFKDKEIIARWLSLATEVPVVLDAVLEGQAEEYQEAAALQTLLRPQP